MCAEATIIHEEGKMLRKGLAVFENIKVLVITTSLRSANTKLRIHTNKRW